MKHKWRVQIQAKALRTFEVEASNRDEALAKALERAKRWDDRWLATLHGFKVIASGVD